MPNIPTNTPVPYERLETLQEKLGVGPADFEILAPFRTIFTARRKEFAEDFQRFFLDITETRIMLEHQRDPGFLRRAWARWFEFVFTSEVDRPFLAYLWHIGVRHVEVNLDQRFSNLGFSVVRQFCQHLILADVPSATAGPVLAAVDRLLDLCLLVETSAYIENTTRCDIEVIRGVADRVRNPSVVIGGNLKRLQKKVPPDSREFKIYEKLIIEISRLESMFRDITVYMQVFADEPTFGTVHLKGFIEALLERMERSGVLGETEIDLNLDERAVYVQGDVKLLEYLFFSLIQNAVEAADPANPYVRISSAKEDVKPYHVSVQIFNTGIPPEPEEIERYFSPFYSTKPSGTGFGLPIARIVVKKHFGRLTMEPVAGQGTLVSVHLPGPG